MAKMLVLWAIYVSMWMFDCGRCKDEIVEEICPFKTFNATCHGNDVILMTSARYGRMKLGDCLNTDYSTGCSADVLSHVDSRCSGRRHCLIQVPDPVLFKMQPCRKDLMVYLETSYTCVKATALTTNTGCPSVRHLRDSSGYIMVSSSTPAPHQLHHYKHGNKQTQCTLNIKVKPGQQINVSIIDLNPLATRPTDRGANRAHTFCSIYAEFHEKHKSDSLTVCGNEDIVRGALVYTSLNNELNVTVDVAQIRDIEARYLLRYEDPEGFPFPVNDNVTSCLFACVVIKQPTSEKIYVFYIITTASGCANIVDPSMKMERVDDTLTMTCAMTSEKWHLICKGNEWIGDFSNCTAGGNTAEEKLVDNHRIPTGVLAAIAIGVLLGVLAGFVFLLLAFVCRTRLRRGHHFDVHGGSMGDNSNMYKLADVHLHADDSNDPCYYCHNDFNTTSSIYTRSCLESKQSTGNRDLFFSTHCADTNGPVTARQCAQAQSRSCDEIDTRPWNEATSTVSAASPFHSNDTGSTHTVIPNCMSNSCHNERHIQCTCHPGMVLYTPSTGTSAGVPNTTKKTLLTTFGTPCNDKDETTYTFGRGGGVGKAVFGPVNNNISSDQSNCTTAAAQA